MYLTELLDTRPTLYHGTSFFGAVHIIRDNAFKAKTEHDLDVGHVMGVSFTRNRRFATAWGRVVFELDRDRLAQRYRLIPHNYWRGNERTRQDAREEAEEFIVGPVTDATRYIVAIHMTAKELGYMNKLNGPHEAFYEPLRANPLLRVG